MEERAMEEQDAADADLVIQISIRIERREDEKDRDWEDMCWMRRAIKWAVS
jgi:hypothetical protein